ncbi:gamma-glutamyl-gamma-aminobutyrate hydrolase family protein [Membranicola marinus]|uniref:Gamma-glutamyl-gamma-aminobutyrate hydrolase family protein n=1 Tax=Membranihabitans marinus TaxID=1227546 RepID=A0A953HUM7_9BACT|nr:gamma-glutamyl-gamma-aminobutyrate hydrolase family protein [Membranihabitans marinus]MBY5958760.1 gamma-glutamyl-gamma-aminobutyrate hydrolase family protein [Membranihabitans marinus]
MIKIGISSCFMYSNPKRIVFGPKSLSYIENDMARYVTTQDVLPVLIPDVAEPYLTSILQQLDGVVLQGGSDLAPESYGESPIGKWKGDAYRDRYELKILDFAIQQSLPVLGICRGFQLMNVYFGGTLYQDISTQLPKAILHRSAEDYDQLHHAIRFEENNFLQTMYADIPNPQVNTVHHQAIKKLGSDLNIYARSEDGLIEAFGYSKEPEGKVFGVQWHPEFSPTLAGLVIPADRIYRRFLDYARKQYDLRQTNQIVTP